MGLLPLEFSDCILDSPYFRENLRAHEKQLDQTSTEIKGIIKDIKDVLDAAKVLSKAKRTLASSLNNFQFDCIGTTLTDDEIIIAASLKEFAKFLSQVEDEMDRMLDHAYEKFIAPLVKFRKHHIGSVKKIKKDFDKQTSKFCAAQDRYVNLSSKKEESLAEAAEALRQEGKNLNASSLEYVYLMHIVQERKKFEFVESILSFMHIWANYYKHGHSVSADFSNYMTDLKSRVQKSRENYSATIEQYDSFKQKMMSGHQDPGVFNKMYTRQGYLYVLNNKKAGNLKLGSQWAKHYCQYQAKTKTLTMIPYNQLTGKIATGETIRVDKCICKEETTEKFRFDVTGEDLSDSGTDVRHTLQALSDWDRKHWVEAMGGTWPAVNTLQRIRADSVEENLNSVAFSFLKDCLSELESRDLSDQGLYRVGGVISKVKRLLNLGLDPQAGEEPIQLSDPKLWESKTIASAVKQYFRDLNKPLMTHHLYNNFIEAVKHESETQRIYEIQLVLQKLPIANREVLKVLIRHLNKVSLNSKKNLMTASNLGVCFGPTLLRPKEETVASIMDIKFCNEVIEILIENCDRFFPTADSSPEVLHAYRKYSTPGGESRSIRGSSMPKRTHSFSSFSQISTNSLPDIKEFNNERPRSRLDAPLKLQKTNEDLMASLEMMNSLAADLPTSSSSTLKRSFTMHAKRLEVARKPPLPKLSIQVRHNSVPNGSESKIPSSPRPLRPTDLYVRQISISSEESSPAQPTVPTRRYRKVCGVSLNAAATAAAEAVATDLRTTDSGVRTTPSPPTDSGIAVSPAIQQKGVSNQEEDVASVISSALSEGSSNGSKYENYKKTQTSHDEDGDDEEEEDLSEDEHLVLDSSSEEGEAESFRRNLNFSLVNKRISGPYENVIPRQRSSSTTSTTTTSSSLTIDDNEKRHHEMSLPSLKRMLRLGQTTNV